MDEQTSPQSGRARIFAVVVLYRETPATSTTVATLARALQAPGAPECHVLLYDNTPANERAETAVPSGFRYEVAAANRGLYGAYETALIAAAAEGCEWLLTLDQDTALPLDFFAALQPGLAAAERDPRIAAIVPHLVEGTRLLSPAFVGMGRATPLPADFEGTPAREARAFNSAALLRVRAIESMGGFDSCFWLDHLDSWLHHQLYVRGWRMYVVGSLTLEHHFSLLDYANRLSPQRFENFLSAEGAYIDLYGSRLARLAYTAQLGVRWLNQWRRGEAAEIRSATHRMLLRRMRVGKQARIAEWRAAADCAPAVAEDAQVQQ